MRHEPPDNRYSAEARYNTKVVVRETGVPADTFRAWERRYGVPQPHRTETGQRLYSERDIAVVRWLRDRTAEGMTISQAVRLLHGEESAAPAAQEQPAAWEMLQHRLVDALLQLDTNAADTVLGDAFARFTVDDVCVKLITPVLVEIGEGWHRGTVSIGQEHFATQLLRRKLQALLNVYDVSRGHTTVVAACAPGEQHDVGLLILALHLARRGFRVYYLGADVPVQGLQPIVQQVKADIVCISAATTVSAAQILEVADALRRLPRPPVVLAGGRGISSDIAANDLFINLNADLPRALERIDEIVAQLRG